MLEQEAIIAEQEKLIRELHAALVSVYEQLGVVHADLAARLGEDYADLDAQS